MIAQVGPWSTVSAIAGAVGSGHASALEIAEAAIGRSLRVQDELNCFAEIDALGARQAAADIDRRRAAGEALGPLAGVPVAIKDCTPVAGLGNRFGSRAFASNVALEDAILVQRFRRADAVIVGKTTLSEFASSSFCDSPLTGVTRNPWNPERTPGGSSGGSAVAVATGCVAVAHGTDMGGSVRIPASCTGLVGIKPAAGRIPLDDQPSFVDDIQHHGLLTRTVADLTISLPALCGRSADDPSTYRPPLPALDAAAEVSELRIAVSDDLGFFIVEPEVRERLNQAANELQIAGAVVERVALDWDRLMADAWVRHWHVYLAAFFGAAIDRIGPLADSRLVNAIARGRGYDAVSIKQSELVRRRQWSALERLFRDYDVLLSPTMTRPAVGVDEDDARYHVDSFDGKKRGLDMTSLFNWVPWCPALNVPAGLSNDGLPIGLHVCARPQREDIALRVAAAVERSFPFRWPPGWDA